MYQQVKQLKLAFFCPLLVIKFKILHHLGKLKKTHIDGLSLTHLKPPPPSPPNVGLIFFPSHHCFIVLFQFLDIYFYIESKKM